MNCDEWKAFHQDYAAGTLSDAARDAVERHLSDCGSCFADVRALKRIDAELRADPVLEAPTGLVDAVMAATRPAESRPTFTRELVKLAAAALLVAGLGAAAWHFAPIDQARPITDTSKGLIDAIRGQVEKVWRF